jgi:hypothetical protein
LEHFLVLEVTTFRLSPSTMASSFSTSGVAVAAVAAVAASPSSAKQQTRPKRVTLAAEAAAMAGATSASIIDTPHAHDVLSGRGGGVNRHAGNEFYRVLIRTYKVPYSVSPRKDKAQVPQLIIDAIRQRSPPGRFLLQDPTNKNVWREMTPQRALDKTKQALREQKCGYTSMGGKKGDDFQ